MKVIIRIIVLYVYMYIYFDNDIKTKRNQISLKMIKLSSIKFTLQNEFKKYAIIVFFDMICLLSKPFLWKAFVLVLDNYCST